MPLKNLKTDLKSLKYGQDRFNSKGDVDSSSQPYITTDINLEDGLAVGDSFNRLDNSSGGKDFLLRGGINAPNAAIKDAERLSKYFTDVKSPSGFLFITKQNLLSQVLVKTQTDLTPNEGIYSPISTITQAGSGYLGTHLYKQGLDPFKGTRTYTDVVKGVDNFIKNIPSITSIEGNRLVNFYNSKIESKQEGDTLYSYGGGPGSTLGIGKTIITLSDQRTGINNTKLQSIGFFPPPPTPKKDISNANSKNPIIPQPYGYSVFKGKLISLNSETLIRSNNSTVTTRYKSVSTNSSRTNLLTNIIPTSGSSIVENTTVYPSYTNTNPSFAQSEGNRIYDQKTNVLTQAQISEQSSSNSTTPGSFQQDYRTELGLKSNGFSTVTGLAPSYKPKEGQTYEGGTDSRVHMSSPGQEGNRMNYSKGKILPGDVTSIVDKINFQPIYQSRGVLSEEQGIAKNDLVKFRIAALNKSDANLKQYIHFRAFINEFSDSYGANWTGQSYMGRGEQFYKYGGFTRDVNISFTVAAQSKPELMAQYKKLNFLASNLAPTYSDLGYMGGPLIELTLGGWCYELPGFIGSLNLGVPQESPWEISINEVGKFDNSVKEMPHIVNVTMKFTPIHKFRPEKQKNTYNGNYGEVDSYGKQRYIQLKATTDNYQPKNFSDFKNIVTTQPTE